MNYKQCLLTRPVIPGTVLLDRLVTWLPEEFAKVGKVLDLKMPNEWDRGWTVKEVFTTKPEEYVREHERDYRTQSLASDKTTPNKGLGLKKE